MKFSKIFVSLAALLAAAFILTGCAAEAPQSEGAIVSTDAGVFMVPTEFSIIEDGELVPLDCHGFLPFTCEGNGVKLTFHRVKNNNFALAEVETENGVEYSCGWSHLDSNCVIKD